MAAEGNNIIRRYIYRGEEGEVIPRDGKIIVIVREDVTVILAGAFDFTLQFSLSRTRQPSGYRNIIEAICHEGVEKIELGAFYECPSLRRVIMPGVKVVERQAFYRCTALTDVECGNLEIIKFSAFNDCRSLRSINLPSARIVKKHAFDGCLALTDVKFSNKLERIEQRAFADCRSLERITIPLKDGLITDDYHVFMRCENLNRVDLVEGVVHETVSALLLDEWRNDMSEEIDSINQILPNIRGNADDVGRRKFLAIRMWIRSVLRKINHYKAEHQRILDEEVATTLQLALPHDIVMNHVLPFLVLPSYTFEVGDGRE